MYSNLHINCSYVSSSASQLILKMSGLTSNAWFLYVCVLCVFLHKRTLVREVQGRSSVVHAILNTVLSLSDMLRNKIFGRLKLSVNLCPTIWCSNCRTLILEYVLSPYSCLKSVKLSPFCCLSHASNFAELIVIPTPWDKKLKPSLAWVCT